MGDQYFYIEKFTLNYPFLFHEFTNMKRDQKITAKKLELNLPIFHPDVEQIFIIVVIIIFCIFTQETIHLTSIEGELVVAQLRDTQDLTGRRVWCKTRGRLGPKTPPEQSPYWDGCVPASKCCILQLLLLTF